MASISNDQNGNRTIQFVAGDGKRRSIRLGKLPLKAVREIKTKIEALNASSIAKISLDRETAEWVGRLDSVLYDKLSNAGLLEKRGEAVRATLGAWLDSYFAIRSDVKESTSTAWGHTRRCLVDYFGESKSLAEIAPGDADGWRIWLGQHEELSENTVKRRCGIAKQFFRAALRRRLMAENPFADLKGISVQRNPHRHYFISRNEAARVLEACPDAQWRLLFALSRFGGLRCPSEHLALRWGDVDWERGRITVRSPNTEHYDGKECRVMPIFPELQPYLEQVFDEAEAGTTYVITRYRDRNSNLRTQLERIIAKAGLQPWPKLFQNLRSTRETELAESFPLHVVCQWIGNSQTIAQQHYLQVTDEHFAKASEALHNPVQQPAEMSRNRQQVSIIPPLNNAEQQAAASTCDYLPFVQVGAEGLEPPTSTL